MNDLKLEYLTNDAELVELCRLYWEVDSEFNFIHTVSKIAREFGLSVRDVSKTVSQSSLAHSITQRCERCGNAHSYTSRSDYQQKHNRQFSWACGECDKIEREEARREYQIEQERIRVTHLAQLEQQRRIIKNTFTLVEPDSLDAKSLSLESAVYLLSLIRLGASEDFAYIEPVPSFTENLAPTEKYTYDTINHLYHQKLIMPHPESPANAFDFEDGEIKSYYPSRIIWNLPFGKDYDEKRNLISELERIFKDKDWPDGWHHEWQPLWKIITVQECLEYLVFALQQHEFSFTPGDKTLLLFNTLLDDYSVAQAYNLIWRAAKDAASFYVRQHVTRPHAANYAINSMQRSAERGRAEGWDVTAYRRNYNCPQSAVSSVLFNTVLQIGDAGFNTSPGKSEQLEAV